MLFLPTPPRRAWLRSFWLTLTSLCGLACGVVAATFYTPAEGALSVLVAVMLALLGWRWPEIASGPYRAWNWLMRCLAITLRRLVLAICYYLLIVAVGRTRAALLLARPNPSTSLWESRGGPPSSVNAQDGTIESSAAPPPHWVRTYVFWTIRSGNAWAVVLLPFLWLLAVVDFDQSAIHSSEKLYTLF